MAKAIGHIGNQVEVSTFWPSKKTVNRVDEYSNNVDIFPFVKTSNVVGFCYFPLMKNSVNGT